MRWSIAGLVLAFACSTTAEEIRAVAEVGDTMPGFPADATLRQVAPYAVGVGGHIVFGGSVQTARAGRTRAVWTGRFGAVDHVASAGDPLADAPATVTFGQLLDDLIVTPTGRFAASGFVLDETGPSPRSRTAAFAFADGTLRLLGYQQGPAPGYPSNTFLGSVSVVAAHDAGVVFTATVFGAGGERPLWYRSFAPGSETVVVAGPRTTLSPDLPHCTFTNTILSAKLTASNDLYVLGTLRSQQPGLECPFSVIAATRPGSGEFRVAVRAGDVVPPLGGPTILLPGLTSSTLAVNDAGDVGFASTVDDEQRNPNAAQLVRRANGEIRLVSTSLESPPGVTGSRFRYLSAPLTLGGEYAYAVLGTNGFQSWLLRSRGRADLVHPDYSDPGETTMQAVARTGDAAAGFPATVTYASFSGVTALATGGAAFGARISAGPTGMATGPAVFRVDPAGRVERIAWRGAPVAGGGALTDVGERVGLYATRGGGVSDATDSGQIAFLGARNGTGPFSLYLSGPFGQPPPPPPPPEPPACTDEPTQNGCAATTSWLVPILELLLDERGTSRAPFD